MLLSDAFLGGFTACLCWAVALALLTVSVQRLRATHCPSTALFTAGAALSFALLALPVPAVGVPAFVHGSGGLLLALMLGPYAAFCALCLALAGHSLLLGHGGLLAWGAHALCFGFFPCFLVYPFLYKPLAGIQPTARSLVLAGMAGGIASTQCAALTLPLLLWASGTAGFALAPFSLLLQPLFLNIGMLEGLIAASAALLFAACCPALLHLPEANKPRWSEQKLACLLLGIGCTLSLGAAFAPQQKPALLWASLHSGGLPAQPMSEPHNSMAWLQSMSSSLPQHVHTLLSAVPLPLAGHAIALCATLACAWLCALLLRRHAKAQQSI
jgi:cobalt/nickel transport system permease protein